MHLRYALMALLGDGEAHGYALKKRFTERVGPWWHPNIGQIYQVLHELERRGHVSRRDVATGARLRRLFRLTTRGERALRTWVARRPSWPPPLRDEVIVRILAVEQQGVAALLAQLERHECEYRRYLASVQSDAPPGGAVTRRLAREAAVGLAEAHLRWLGRCRQLLLPGPGFADRHARGETGVAACEGADAAPP